MRIDNPFVIAKKEWTKESYDEWFASLKIKDTPKSSREDRFEIKYTGEKNFRLIGSSRMFWADGIVEQTILETKLVLNAERSPFVSPSKIPDFVRESIDAKTRSEFDRIALILRDDNNPLTFLRVIVNDDKAIPYFESLLLEFEIPGEVVVRPE
jgi:hypothetical protein